MIWRALFALVFLAAPAVAGVADTPEAIAQGFYTAVLSLKEGGIPDSAARARLEPFISPALAHTLAAANEAELAYAQNSRHAVPPLLEGDIFVSLFDGASKATVGSCHGTAAGAECPAALSYHSPSGRTYHWQDTLRLTHTAIGWRVDDVIYGGGVPYANRGTLTSNLAFAIRNARGR
ncbi:MAG: hypothetical protein KGO02_05915 [Alphaproteobacteria bacterium]|nr:hypothetical protein [Alphaproteobacteria bacterium]